MLAHAVTFPSLNAYLLQSNGPFELLPVVNDFLQLSQLPPGSVRLRSYGGRSLFNGLLSAPAVRKRSAVVDVLNHFPDARFFLVGDSGEQDLELYAEVARERPDQILGIFIRADWKEAIRESRPAIIALQAFSHLDINDMLRPAAQMYGDPQLDEYLVGKYLSLSSSPAAH